MHRVHGAAFAASLLVAGFSHTAAAAATFVGTTNAFWSNPVLTGDTVDPVTGITTPSNDTTTAACNLAGCPIALPGDPTTTLAWGNNPEASVLTFTPHPISANSGQVFDFGTVTYFNGNSGNGTIIFGADLNVSFALTNTTKTINPKVIHITITTTANTGTPQQNADFIGFPANLNVTFNVLEEGTASAELTGVVTGDPVFHLVNLVLDPNSVGTGFIVSVGEPPALAMIPGVLVGLAILRRRSRPRLPMSNGEAAAAAA